ncbi:MAG: hypothetical protein HKP25_06735 [Marinicaulis sp.]|nr:hypothetical protein [Marinicaulis sp.]NNL88749.1 hypothetical protein [Marinicaulis sp.]
MAAAATLSFLVNWKMTELFFLRVRGGSLLQADGISPTNNYLKAGVFPKKFISEYQKDETVEVIPALNIVKYVRQNVIATGPYFERLRHGLKAVEN